MATHLHSGAGGGRHTPKARDDGTVWLVAFFPCLLACAATSPAATADVTPQKTCTVRVDANGYVPAIAPVKVVKAQSTSHNERCYSPASLVAEARAIACSEGHLYVGIVNIQEPLIPFLAPCYSADLEFYATAEGATVSRTPILRYAHVPPTGVQVLVGGAAASLLSGPQDGAGLVNSNGDKADTEKLGFGITLRYHPLPYLGAELATGGLFGRARAPQTDDMNVTREWISNLGLSLIPWQRMTLAGRVQVFASAGVSYTRLALTEAYKTFVRENSPGVAFYGGPATGFGWYARLGPRVIVKHGIIIEAGLRYAQSWPRFPDAAQSFWSRQLGGDIAVGYQF